MECARNLLRLKTIESHYLPTASKPSNEQTIKQTINQLNKQTNKRTNKQTNKQTKNKQTNKQTNKQKTKTDNLKTSLIKIRSTNKLINLESHPGSKGTLNNWVTKGKER